MIRYDRVIEGVETLSARAFTLQYDRHFHDTYAFGLILEGVERCGVGRKLHFYEPGTVPLFNPGEVHDGGPATKDGWSYRMVYVDTARVEGARAFDVPSRRDPAAEAAVRRLFDAIDSGSALGIDEALQVCLQTLLGPAACRAADVNLHRVRERIDAHSCDALRLRDLCAEAGVSPTRLLRAFEKVYGLSPHRYQQARRIAAARRMIAGRMPLAEVAAACGYADQSHLNRWFRRICGTTPGRYRRNFLQDGGPIAA